MLADSLLKNRVLEAINAKRWCARGTSDGWPPSLSKVACVLRASSLPLSWALAGDVSLPVAIGGTHPRVVGGPPTVWVPPDRGAVTPGRLERKWQAGAARAPCGRLAGAATAQTPDASW